MQNSAEKICKNYCFQAVKERCRLKLLFAVQEEESSESAVEKNQRFNQLFEEYFDKVYQFFFFRLRNETVAEDLAAQTFEKIYKHLDGYEDRGYKISAWIFTIARNNLNDYFRKNRHHIESIDDLTPSKEPAKDFDLGKLDSKMLTEKLWEAIGNLPKKQQELWSYKLTEDLPHKEIAELMKTSEANINVMLHRSIKLLKQQLEHYVEE